MSAPKRNIRTAATILFDGQDYEAMSAAKAKTRALKGHVMALQMQRTAAGGTAPPARGGDADDLADAEERAQEAEAAEDELIEAARHRATEVRMKGLGRKAWRDLVEAHPPRPANEGDGEVGYDRTTFPDAVVYECLHDPDFQSKAEKDEWLDDLTDGESDHLFNIAFGLNRGAPADPKVSPRSVSLS